MIKRLLSAAVLACFAFGAIAPAFAAEKKPPKAAPKKAEDKEKKEEKKPAKKPPPPKKEEEGKVGYTTTVIQMNPMMAPYRTSTGVRYELLTARLELSPDDATQRGACFMVPVIHEKMLMYLASAKLQQADFSGQRRDVLAKNLYDVVIQTTDKSLFTGLKLVDVSAPPLKEHGSDTQIVDSDPPLSQRSATLSAQCK